MRPVLPPRRSAISETRPTAEARARCRQGDQPTPGAGACAPPPAPRPGSACAGVGRRRLTAIRRHTRRFSHPAPALHTYPPAELETESVIASEPERQCLYHGTHACYPVFDFVADADLHPAL